MPTLGPDVSTKSDDDGDGVNVGNVKRRCASYLAAEKSTMVMFCAALHLAP